MQATKMAAGGDMGFPNEPAARQPARRYRGLTLGFSLLVFTASVWYIQQTFQWRDLGRVLKTVNLTCLIAGGGASIMAFWWLRTLRWQILLRRNKTHIPLVDLYLCSAVALSFSLVTPFQSGEMLKIELLKNHGRLQRAPGYGSFLVERVLDFASLLTIACVCILTSTDILPGRAHAHWILGGLALACAAAWFALQKFQSTGRPQRLLAAMRQCVGDVPTLLLVTAITGAAWAMMAVGWQVFLFSTGIELGFAQTLTLMSIVALVSILSLIPGGLGISEAGCAQLLMHFGCAAALAQAGSLVLRSCSLVAIALGLAHWGLWKFIQSRRTRHHAACAANPA